jgi:cytochrome c oxidase subunit IV
LPAAFFFDIKKKRRTAMIWWVLFLTVLSILSYLSDLGMFAFQNLRVPFLNASLLSVFILLAAAGILARMLSMRRRGRRERLEKKVRDLEGKLALFGSRK